MSRVSASALILLTLGGLSAGAQAQRGRPAPSGSATDVRAELAAVLLQSRRYAEAAREYRLVLAREPRNYNARLGLARALAWGDQPRAAEYELRVLRGLRPGDREVNGLLESVRESMEPTAAEASSWVAERPGHVPYRRALARALVREERFSAALPHYNWLLTYDRTTPFVIEAVNAHREAGDYQRATDLLRGLQLHAAGDTAVRHALASTLASRRQYDAALATFDTLITWYPQPALLVERAQVHLARRDLASAEADARAALQMRPNVGAYLLLGDLLRWRGDYGEARRVYDYAAILDPDDPDVIAAAGQLLRDERPIIAFVSSDDYAADWQVLSSSVNDNEGVAYATVSARRQAALDYGLVASAEAELRRLGGEQMRDIDVGVTGVGLRLGLMREFTHGPYLLQLSARAGVVKHNEGSIPTASARAAGWAGPWGIALEYGTAPAYPSLLTAGSIRPPGGDGEPLTESSTRIALGGPLSRVDAAFSMERTDISDGNDRTTVQALLRYPLTTSVAVLAAATGIWFTERTPLYWDPSSYYAGAGGLELAQRRTRGWSAAARVLGGPARSTEQVIENRNARDETNTALQLSAGGDLSYRTESRELGLAVMYGSGRAGSYRRLEANLFMRLLR